MKCSMMLTNYVTASLQGQCLVLLVKFLAAVTNKVAGNLGSSALGHLVMPYSEVTYIARVQSV